MEKSHIYLLLHIFLFASFVVIGNQSLIINQNLIQLNLCQSVLIQHRTTTLKFSLIMYQAIHRCSYYHVMVQKAKGSGYLGMKLIFYLRICNTYILFDLMWFDSVTHYFLHGNGFRFDYQMQKNQTLKAHVEHTNCKGDIIQLPDGSVFGCNVLGNFTR